MSIGDPKTATRVGVGVKIRDRTGLGSISKLGRD